jgi:cytochrome P450
MGSFKFGHFVAPADMWSEDNCYEWYKKMRYNTPISYDRKRRCWDIFRYKDAKTVLQNHKVFSSERYKDKVDSLLSMDPPEHKKFRSIANKEFGSQYRVRMETLIREITEDKIKRIEKGRQIDFIQEIAHYIPATMMMRLLGVSEQYYQEIIEMSLGGLTRSNSTNQLKAVLKKVKNSIHHGNRFFERLMKEKQRYPQDDMTSDLLIRHGQDISFSKIRDFLYSVLTAGNETSINLIGNTLYLFSTQPNVWSRLQTDPSLIPRAIEEVLRFHPSVHNINRIATEDIEMNGFPIKKGDEVVVWLASANRDEEIFDHADEFQMDRSPNTHLAFGYGIHTCIGNSLARLEANIIFHTLLERFPKIMIVEKPVHNNNFVFQGFEHIYMDIL